MANFSVSPGITTREVDLTGVVPAVSASIGAYAGKFQWGPSDEFVNVGNEKELANYFGIPTKAFAESYLTAASFLKYGNTLLVSRAVNSDTALNASNGNNEQLIKNLQDFDDKTLADNFYARYPGAYGDSIDVIIQSAKSSTRIKISALALNGGDVNITITETDLNADTIVDGDEIFIAGVRSGGDLITALSSQKIYIGDVNNATDDVITGTIYNDSDLTEKFVATGYTNTTFDSTALEVAYVTTPGARMIERSFSTRPGTSAYATKYGVEDDEIHVLVIDRGGRFTGTPGAILESFGNLSLAADARADNGASVYYKTNINQRSNYIYVDGLSGIITGADAVIKDDPSAVSFTLAYASPTEVLELDGGTDGTDLVSSVVSALDVYGDTEVVDISLIFAQNDNENQTTIARKLISIAEARKDCVAFISPDVEVKDRPTDDLKLKKVLAKFDVLPSSSYAVFDSSPVYVYDKYNDEYVWTSAAGHIAGLCARTDATNDPWWSPAGYQRGNLLGVAKLAFVPKQNHRDELYKSRVNPIVSFPGEGIILYGDKTAQSTASAFDRINVRRLFIVMRKAVSEAAKRQLFQFNDEFTRAQFRNLVNPYLRDVQGRRGITDFQVVCDETNNPGQVTDTNRFVGDIYVKPNRSINFIGLNFIATRTDVEFEEIIGQF